MNKWEITKDWISYLKGMRIVELESDPETGKLIYRRQPKVEDLYTFLVNQTDFEKDAVVNAIKMMLSRSSGQQSLPPPHQSQQQNQARQSVQQPRLSQTGSPKQLPSPRRPPVERIKEDLVDNPGRAVSEKEVELVIDILVSSSGQVSGNQSGDAQQQKGQPDKAADLKKIKQHIRTQMTPEEIMGLWRNLKNA